MKTLIKKQLEYLILLIFILYLMLLSLVMAIEEDSTNLKIIKDHKLKTVMMDSFAMKQHLLFTSESKVVEDSFILTTLNLADTYLLSSQKLEMKFKTQFFGDGYAKKTQTIVRRLSRLHIEYYNAFLDYDSWIIDVDGFLSLNDRAEKISYEMNELISFYENAHKIHMTAVKMIILVGTVAVIALISFSFKKIKNYEVEILNKAYKDDLTGVKNRRALYELLDDFCSTKPEFLLYIDIDNFKAVNDYCGHNTGDFVLQSIAKTIGSVVGTENVFRIGGDEFLVYPHNWSKELSSTTISNLTERILSDFKKSDFIEKTFPQSELGLSIGAIKCYDFKNLNCIELIDLADETMLRAKKWERTDHLLQTGKFTRTLSSTEIVLYTLEMC